MILKNIKHIDKEFGLNNKAKSKLSESFLTEQKYIDLSEIVIPFSKIRVQNQIDSEKELLTKRKAELNNILKRELMSYH